MQPLGRPQRVVPADGYQGVEPLRLHGGQDTIGAFVGGVGIGAGRAQDRPSLGQDGPTLLDGEWDRRVLEDTEPTIEEADALVTVTDGATHDDSADDGVQSRTVTPAGEDADSHPVMIERPSSQTPAHWQTPLTGTPASEVGSAHPTATTSNL